MADDLDELLDEIEDSLSQNKVQISKKQENVFCADEDIDRIIDDICSDDDPPSAKSAHTQAKTSSLSPTKSRCKSLLLGGSVVTMGLYEAKHQRSCDKLRCTSCDFPVMWFNNQAWNSKCDYLFFRNNMPDRDKLQQNLVRKKGSRAYACQCSWESVDKTVDVSHMSRLKWVCGRH